MRSNLRSSADAIERPSEVLPTPGGPTKQRIEPRASGFRLPHGEELDDAVLDALDVVVVGVEHLARVAEVEVVLGRGVPRQRRDPLEVGADDAVLGRRLGQPLEPRELAVGDLADLLGQLDLGELLAQLLDLGLRRVALAELLLDRLELLAQEVLALGLVELRLDLRLDPRAHRGDLELIGEDLRQPPQALGDVALLEQRLLVLRLDPQRAGDQVRERRRVVEVGDRELELLGQVRDLLDDGREGLLDVAHQRRQLRALVDDVGRLGDARDEVGRLGDPLVDADALAALDEDPQRPVGHLEHARDGAHDAVVVELVGRRRLRVRVAAAHHHELAVAGEHVVDEPHRALLADRQRRQRVGEGDGVAQRQDRQLRGQRRRAERDVAAAVAEGLDVDRHDSPSPPSPPDRRPGSIGTVCASAGPTTGSSTTSMPSS